MGMTVEPATGGSGGGSSSAGRRSASASGGVPRASPPPPESGRQTPSVPPPAFIDLLDDDDDTDEFGEELEGAARQQYGEMLEQARANVASAEAQLTNARTSLARARELRTTGAGIYIYENGLRVLAAVGASIGSLWLLSAGTLLVGVYQGFGQFYRFAAGELAAIGLGVVQGLLDPDIGPLHVQFLGDQHGQHGLHALPDLRVLVDDGDNAVRRDADIGIELCRRLCRPGRTGEGEGQDQAEARASANEKIAARGAGGRTVSHDQNTLSVDWPEASLMAARIRT